MDRSIARALIAALAAAPAPTFVHAQRGGTAVAGAPTFAEATLPAYRNAFGRLGAVLAMDVKLTRDRVPVLFHDATLDRLTACTGRVADRTFAELAKCPVTRLGSPGGQLAVAPAPAPEPIATLASVLDYARSSGATVSVEIENVPADPDFDATTAFAGAVLDVVDAAKLPAANVIVQSSWPANLEETRRRDPALATSLRTQAGSTNEGSPAYAAGRAYTWIAPQWPVSTTYVSEAHALGLRVVPYTLDTADDVKAARESGADAVLSDDPLTARRAVGIPDPPPDGGAGPVVRIGVPEATWRSFASPELILRWRGMSRYRLAGFEAEVREGGSSTWRLVSRGGKTGVRFRARPGAAYELRVRAQDYVGNLSPYAVAPFVVPLDERDRRVRLGGPWQAERRPGAWLGAVATARDPRAVAQLSFSGTRLRVIGPRLGAGGRLEVRVDGRVRVVSVRGRGQDRKVLVDIRGLRRGRHVARLRPAGGGPVALDALAPS